MPAGRTAIVAPVPASTSAQRCTIPSPPQTNTTSAPASRAARACFGACLLFNTSYHRGSSTPWARRTSRSSVRPPPSCLRVWAITATVVMPTPPAAGRGAVTQARGRHRGVRERSSSLATRTAKTAMASAPTPIRPPNDDVAGVVHAAVHACGADGARQHDHDGVGRRSDPAVRRRGTEQQRDRAPEHDRRGDVPGRKARRARLRTELRHVRAGSTDDAVDGEEGEQLEPEADRARPATPTTAAARRARSRPRGRSRRPPSCRRGGSGTR